MAEYIDRDAAIAACLDGYADCRADCAANIRSIPAANVVERKTGKWVKISPAGIYECSQCGQNIMTSDIEVYKFCHGCGAKMIGGDDDGA